METYTTCFSTDNHLSKRPRYCSLCDKSMNFNGKSGRINSNFQQRRERLAFTVQKFDVDTPDFNKPDSILQMLLKKVEIDNFTLSSTDMKMIKIRTCKF